MDRRAHPAFYDPSLAPTWFGIVEIGHRRSLCRDGGAHRDLNEACCNEPLTKNETSALGPISYRRAQQGDGRATNCRYGQHLEEARVRLGDSDQLIIEAENRAAAEPHNLDREEADEEHGDTADEQSTCKPD